MIKCIHIQKLNVYISTILFFNVYYYYEVVNNSVVTLSRPTAALISMTFRMEIFVLGRIRLIFTTIIDINMNEAKEKSIKIIKGKVCEYGFFLYFYGKRILAQS